MVEANPEFCAREEARRVKTAGAGSLDGAEHAAEQQAGGAPGSAPPRRQLTVGYVSPDFVTHSVSYFIQAPLQCHDRDRFRVICYSAVQAKEDVKTTVLQVDVLTGAVTAFCPTLCIPPESWRMTAAWQRN